MTAVVQGRGGGVKPWAQKKLTGKKIHWGMAKKISDLEQLFKKRLLNGKKSFSGEAKKVEFGAMEGRWAKKNHTDDTDVLPVHEMVVHPDTTAMRKARVVVEGRNRRLKKLTIMAERQRA